MFIVRIFYQFEECHDVAIMNGTAFTDAELLQRFIMLMELTNAYNNVVTKWNGQMGSDKMWVNLKA